MDEMDKKDALDTFVLLRVEGLKKFTKVLVVLLIICLLVNTLRVVFFVLQLNLLYSLPVAMEDAVANRTRLAIASVLMTFSFLVGFVLFFIWIYKASWLSREISPHGVSFSPGWAVAWFFIPLANLIMPFFVLNELWKVSVDPVNWPKRPGNKLLLICWLVILFSPILGLIGMRKVISPISVENLRTGTWFFIIKGIIDNILIILFMVFVVKVSNNLKMNFTKVMTGVF